MKSLWSIEKKTRENQATAASLTNSLSTLDTEVGSISTEVGSHHATLVGSATMRFINVASAPTTIPAAGTAYFDTTRNCPIFSNGTSMFLATGSLA